MDRRRLLRQLVRGRCTLARCAGLVPAAGPRAACASRGCGRAGVGVAAPSGEPWQRALTLGHRRRPRGGRVAAGAAAGAALAWPAPGRRVAVRSCLLSCRQHQRLPPELLLLPAGRAAGRHAAALPRRVRQVRALQAPRGARRQEGLTPRACGRLAPPGPRDPGWLLLLRQPEGRGSASRWPCPAVCALGPPGAHGGRCPAAAGSLCDGAPRGDDGAPGDTAGLARRTACWYLSV